MRDPGEGLAPDGTIVTGVRRDRVPETFEPVLTDAIALAGPQVAVYLYGSVATGQAVVGRSDVDLIAVGADPERAAAWSGSLTRRYHAIAREVSVAAATMPEGSSDEDHGDRVFLRHYCLWLAGPDPAAALPAYRGDRAAARGFNGDLPRHLARWRSAAAAGKLGDGALARRVARKTLVAVAGLVSIHDGIWTTDREFAARRWAEVHPELGADLLTLLEWTDGGAHPSSAEIGGMLDTAVAPITQRFVDEIGRWRESPS